MTTPYSTTTGRARFLLLGDSHAGAVGRAARAAGLPFAGGPTGSGRDFLGPFFDPRGADDITFRDAEAERLYRGSSTRSTPGRSGGSPCPWCAPSA